MDNGKYRPRHYGNILFAVGVITGLAIPISSKDLFVKPSHNENRSQKIRDDATYILRLQEEISELNKKIANYDEQYTDLLLSEPNINQQDILLSSNTAIKNSPPNENNINTEKNVKYSPHPDMNLETFNRGMELSKKLSVGIAPSLYENLAQNLLDENRDEGWADPMETSIYSYFSNSENSLDFVECRSSQCKISLQVQDGSQLSKIIMALQQKLTKEELVSAQQAIMVEPSNNGMANLYLTDINTIENILNKK